MMMYPYPKVFDDIISKVKVDIKGSDPITKIIQMMDEKEKKEHEDSEHTAERKDQ